jgi:hypothetical protein
MNAVSLAYLKDVTDGVSETWRAAVAEYSSMKLSRPSDIFPAISGIAHRIREATGWEYVAGMWRETFITDLMWRIATPQTTTRCDEWRAPTFSWASVISTNGSESSTSRSFISYFYMLNLGRGLDKTQKEFKTDLYATVVETHCEPIGCDTEGQLRSAYVILRGTLIAAKLDYNPSRVSPWQVAPLGNNNGPWSEGSLWPDFNFNCEGNVVETDAKIFCLKLIGYSKIVETGYGENLFYLVLKMVAPESSTTLSEDEEECCTFERVALLHDSHGPDAEHLEDVSEDSAIRYNALVRIV